MKKKQECRTRRTLVTNNRCELCEPEQTLSVWKCMHARQVIWTGNPLEFIAGAGGGGAGAPAAAFLHAFNLKCESPVLPNQPEESSVCLSPRSSSLVSLCHIPMILRYILSILALRGTSLFLNLLAACLPACLPSLA